MRCYRVLMFVQLFALVGERSNRATAKEIGRRPVLPDPEITISKYAEDYVNSAKPLGIYIARHFGMSVKMFIALCRMPCHQIVLSARPEGAPIRAMLSRHSTLARMTGLISGVLMLPCAPGQYSVGAWMETIGQKGRKRTGWVFPGPR